MTLGERLKAKREERNLTLREAASEIGCSLNSYRLWEIDAQAPRAQLLEQVRKWIEVDAATLLTELAMRSLFDSVA